MKPCLASACAMKKESKLIPKSLQCICDQNEIFNKACKRKKPIHSCFNQVSSVIVIRQVPDINGQESDRVVYRTENQIADCLFQPYAISSVFLWIASIQVTCDHPESYLKMKYAMGA
jgi:hypothetical protein